MKDVEVLKDPVLKAKLQNIMANPSGDAIAELTEQDMNTLAAAGWYSDFSNYLGNKGKYCTVTKECMPSCN
ncbi:plantaricin C family lantibiotic [Inconstantimicrobium mannanitabidum]|uniref:Uncharacterized protein n=1 Tax=Inconstantimicrobium mannanitabidum TaxID=1604901 RepID=A0ACB5RIM3_9CLOT|nr:plantaricin C family lantibiotic [Clostridium sp. TW13]GKX68943.1 hypothetical protein rsdtw13_42010 [Clostridium sp. TW13]